MHHRVAFLTGLSSSAQQFLVRRPNFITKFVLNFFYLLDAVDFTTKTPLGATLNRIDSLKSKNFCALGKLLVSDFADVEDIINNPQLRGTFLGHYRLIASRMPPSFMLFLDDPFTPEEAKTNRHRILHDFMFQDMLQDAQKRSLEPKFKGYVDEFMKEYRAAGSDLSKADAAFNDLIAKYLFGALFGLDLSEEDKNTLIDLFLNIQYPLAVFWPIGGLMNKLLGVDAKSERMAQLIASSPQLKDYEPSAKNDYLSKEEFSKLYLSISGLAGMIGAKAISTGVMTKIPDDYPIDTSDRSEVLNAVLESARLAVPVGEMGIVLHNDRDFAVRGETVEFQKGTDICLSISGACYDPKEFPDPYTFDPTRSNLLNSVMVFNSVGFSPTDLGTRVCPGRNVALKLCSDLLTAKRATAELN